MNYLEKQRLRRKIVAGSVLAGIGLLVGAQWVGSPDHQPTQPQSEWPLPFELPLSQWSPESPSETRGLDPVIEARIDALLGQMTLRQKVGQMTQAEISHAAPEDVRRYGLGSVLSGGGTWPAPGIYHTVDDWLARADSYWHASQQSELKIPVMWGIDAVHGHNNVFGATLFPHNIGLGAAGDTALVEQIARATAAQVRVTGQDWTFAPNLAVAQNPRWGRFYESFSQQAEPVYHYAKAAVTGLQDNFSDQGILATAKHFVADGATTNGTEKGTARISEATLRNLHSLGYYGAQDADVQVVMAAFNSWWDEPMTGNGYLLNEVLKGEMGFDGFVISDWNALGLVPGCMAWSCPEAINAGIDMVMVPHSWQRFIETTVAQVESGEIPEARIDDAVRRILRVKLRSGLFERPAPSQRLYAGDESKLAGDEVRALARQAVSQSLVMLKNNHQTLPLKKSGRYLLAGNADSLVRQSGGWSLKWQGAHGLNNEDFRTGQTILDGMRELAAAHGGEVTTSMIPGETYDAAVVVISERPYAEFVGDILSRYSTAAERQPGLMGVDHLANIRELRPELPVVVVYLGGRPLWMNPQLNQADAFVAAWLPGTEGGGVADGLFGDYAIDGRLPVNWPKSDCSGAPGEERNALFPVGYGLTFDDTLQLEALPERAALPWGSKQVSVACLFTNLVLNPLK